MSENENKSAEEKNAESKEAENEKVEAVAIDSAAADANNLNMTLFLYWVLPVLILSLVSRFGASPPTPLPPTPPPRPISLDLGGKDSKLAEKLHKRQQKHHAHPRRRQLYRKCQVAINKW